MNSTIVGTLNPVDYDDDIFESAPYPVPYFDNKKLVISFVEANYQPYMTGADQALQNFLKLNPDTHLNDSGMVYSYYKQMLDFGYTQSLDIKTAKDIWNFVYPSNILVVWDENEQFYVCVTCGCAWEEEHDLQLVFKDGKKLTRASGHDGHYND